MVTNTFANYGLGLAELSDPVGDCVQRLEQNFAAPGFQLPMLPKTAWEVRRLTHNPQLKAEQVLAVISEMATQNNDVDTNTQACLQCNNELHKDGAVFCHQCGSTLNDEF